MHRGKIIGAIVLLVAIGLIVAERLGGPEGDTPSPEPSAAVGPAEGSATSTATPDFLPPAGQVRVYSIDPDASEIYWRIYRSGALARLGHNHVISMTGPEGSVTLTDDLDSAAWTLSFPVAGLVIDDPELRARYGEDFASVPSDDDKAGTKTNMLSDRLLNGEMFPEIRLMGTGVTGPLDNAALPVTIELLGRSIEQTFPASISISDDAVTVAGEYRLTHADLGLTPFTALGGAMAVGDEIDFTYRIHAVAGGQ